ncbi:hypothetical protein N431DRAFT_42644 [Stipitochalara longipes BDJ]|nr:hypothetical protein N431DRAFT_42644 [Stipitochalara longipes BDJ]
MKFSILAITAVFSLVSAQNLDGEPKCATSCLISAIAAASCAPTDVSCQCGLSPAVVGPCLIAACNATDLQIALTVGTNLCKSYSATATATNTALTTALTTALNTTLTTSTGFRNSSTVAKTTSTKKSTVTAATTSLAVLGTGTFTGVTPATTSSKAGAPALMAGIGGIVGMLGVVAAL